ncbi:hypothetical protein D777_01894 [Marinobacter nitratireducens]|uniref:Uncharacterized protein n=1 Tax=Marinobacter nitratireducens TaxID=1137280 RepID=A0A072NEM1_9GAMM|nr:hypothetical protein [Marinobacter nitratireducens]KEF31545.1 hypothetical protein D777_01894 [Marinobacter nitratireducens]
MMSDSKQFVLVMVVATLFVGWLGWRGFEVISLNERLKADEIVSSYPYQHRVLRVEGNTAIMSSLRSLTTSTQQALEAVFPSMKNLGDNNREWQRAERELAQLQARSAEIVLESPGIDRIRWELDRNWYHLQTMKSKYDTGL